MSYPFTRGLDPLHELLAGDVLLLPADDKYLVTVVSWVQNGSAHLKYCMTCTSALLDDLQFEHVQCLRELTTVLHSININADKVSPSCVHIPQVPKLETYCNLTELPTRVYFIKNRAVKSAKVEKEDSHYVATTKATLSKRSYNCSWFTSKADADRMLRWLLSSTEEC